MEKKVYPSKSLQIAAKKTKKRVKVSRKNAVIFRRKLLS
jgi:hypothetical protein